MGLLARYLARSPFDDRYFGGGGVVYMDADSGAGPESPLKIATVWRALNVLAGAVASLPIDVFRHIDPTRPDAGKEVAAGDPWRRRLKRGPNRMQTSFRWRHQMVGCILSHGNYYAQKLGAPGQEAEQLWPLDPARMKVKDLLRDGTLVYEYTTQAGRAEPLYQDEVFHARGYSTDGMTGVSVFELMRQTTALALSNRTQRTSFVRNEMRPSAVITTPGELSDPARENLQKGYARAFGGPRRAGRVMVLEQGAKIDGFRFTSRDAQEIESEHFLIEEFLRFTGVPGVLVGHADKTATYASAEQFFQSFVTHGVFPLTSNIEEELTSSLFGIDAEEFVEFNLNAMLRPDSAARAAFYRTMVELGCLTRNEVRALENRNPLPGLDEPLTPGNMTRGSDPQQTPAAPKKPDPEEDEPEPDEPSEKALAIVLEAAGRIVRKELSAIVGGPGKKGAAIRFASDPEGWKRWVAEFYADHSALVRDGLKLSEAAADAYCVAQRTALLSVGVAACEAWERERVPALAELALRD